MVRAVLSLVAVAVLGSVSFGFTTVARFPGGDGCTAPAIWSGVARTLTTQAPHAAAAQATTTASPSNGPTPSQSPAPAASAGVWVAYTCAAGTLLVYNVLTQTVLWRQAVESPMAGSQNFAPTFGDDGAVYATNTYTVYKFDLLTGKRLWYYCFAGPEPVLQGPALVASDVVVLAIPGSSPNPITIFLNATTGVPTGGAQNTGAVAMTDSVTNSKFCAGFDVNGQTMLFFHEGQWIQHRGFSGVQAPAAGYGDVICAAESGQGAGLVCVNTNKTAWAAYLVPLAAALPPAMAGDTIVAIDASGNARGFIKNMGSFALPSSYVFNTSATAPHLPVPPNTTSSIIFGAATSLGQNLLVGIALNGQFQTAALPSAPVGLPSAAFDQGSQAVYVAVTLSEGEAVLVLKA